MIMITRPMPRSAALTAECVASIRVLVFVTSICRRWQAADTYSRGTSWRAIPQYQPCGVGLCGSHGSVNGTGYREGEGRRWEVRGERVWQCHRRCGLVLPREGDGVREASWISAQSTQIG